MKPDHRTYEAWLLDRMEGMLTPEQERELDAFMLAHPELTSANEMLPHVNASADAFPSKRMLKKDFPPAGAPDAARLDDFLIARLEGTLSADQELQLDRYIYEHPEAVREMALMASTKVERSAIPFDDKESIQRHFPPHGLPDAHRLTDFLIAELEGDLSHEQQAALNAYLIAHPGAANERRLMASTRVHVDTINYPGNAALKKHVGRVVPLWTRLAAAASIMLLLSGGWWLLRIPSKNADAGIAQIVKPGPVQPQDMEATATASPSSPSIIPEVPSGDTSLPATRPQETRQRSGSTASTEHSTTHDIDSGSPRTTPRDPVERMDPLPLPKPELADIPKEPLGVGSMNSSYPAEVLASAAPANGQDLGTFISNVVRKEVLTAAPSQAPLGSTDVVAFADKAIHTMTGGQGGVEVQRSAFRERMVLRLGRHFSLSASRGR